MFLIEKMKPRRSVLTYETYLC